MKNNKDKIFISGCAGFIGAAITKKLLNNGYSVIGIDNLNSYYDKNLKLNRIKDIYKVSTKKDLKFIFNEISLEDLTSLEKFFLIHKPKIVLNLAAQAGVRYSIKDPNSYIQSNIVGFSNILELCRKFEISHLVYASSSSVYGGNKKLPFFENHSVDHPVSLYAATKKSNEIMAHTYSHLFKMPCTGLRFFTVYGPWGRPDMAPMIFTKSIIDGEIIKVNNFGDMRRDFTFIDDIVEGIYKCCFKPATPCSNFDRNNPNPSISFAPHRIFNIGNNKPIELMYFISLLEEQLNRKAKIELVPLPIGDVVATAANTDAIEKWVGFKPSISIESGLKKFVSWYKKYYRI